VRILYFGIPLGALALANAGHVPVACVIGPLDLAGRRRLRRRLARTLLLGRPDARDPEVQRLLASTRPDVILSFFWPKRIPREVLALAPAYGTHPSLLPRWRGPDPYFWAIREGDELTGVTLHALEADYDTGGIVDQREVAIGDATSWELARRLDRPALALLLEAAERLRRGPLETRPQDEPLATFAPPPTEEQLAIDWRRSATEVTRLVRAAAPEPGASAHVGGRVVEILGCLPTDARPPPGLRVAEAWREDVGWCVRCGEGAVLLESARDADGPVDLDLLLGGP